MAERLAALGVPIDVAGVLEEAVVDSLRHLEEGCVAAHNEPADVDPRAAGEAGAAVEAGGNRGIELRGAADEPIRFFLPGPSYVLEEVRQALRRLTGVAAP